MQPNNGTQSNNSSTSNNNRSSTGNNSQQRNNTTSSTASASAATTISTSSSSSSRSLASSGGGGTTASTSYSSPTFLKESGKGRLHFIYFCRLQQQSIYARSQQHSTIDELVLTMMDGFDEINERPGASVFALNFVCATEWLHAVSSRASEHTLHLPLRRSTVASLM